MAQNPKFANHRAAPKRKTPAPTNAKMAKDAAPLCHRVQILLREVRVANSNGDRQRARELGREATSLADAVRI